MLLALVVLNLVDPDPVLLPDHVGEAVECLKQVGHPGRPLLDDRAGQLLEVARGRPRPQVKLVDVQHLKLVLLDQAHAALEFLVGLLRETTDDVGGNGDIGHVLQEVVADGLELLDRVLAVHLLQDGVVAGLHRDVDQTVDAWVVEEVRDGAQVVQHVGWVGHAQPDHYLVVVLQLLAQGDQQLGDIGVDVSPVCARVFGGQPDFLHALLDYGVDS